MNIYAGNLSYQLQEEDLRQVFSEFGEVTSVKIITDKFTGKAKGFGFVEMPNDTEAEAAINQLNGQEIKGRQIQVNKARPPKERERNSRW